MSDLDIRMVDAAPELEVRSDENGKTVIRGVAALYNSESRDLGGFTEVLLPGAFDRALADPNLDVFAKLDHERVLGRSISGTLELSLTERGLEYVIHPKKADADVVEALERGDLRGSSFAFRIAKGGDKWERRSDGVTVRTISDIEFLGDVSVVHTPAYPETDNKVFLSARTLEAAKAEAEQREHPVLADAEEIEAEDEALVPDERLARAESVAKMLYKIAKDADARRAIASLRQRD